jgi:hypothetical protein
MAPAVRVRVAAAEAALEPAQAGLRTSASIVERRASREPAPNLDARTLGEHDQPASIGAGRLALLAEAGMLASTERHRRGI